MINTMVHSYLVKNAWIFNLRFLLKMFWGENCNQSSAAQAVKKNTTSSNRKCCCTPGENISFSRTPSFLCDQAVCYGWCFTSVAACVSGR